MSRKFVFMVVLAACLATCGNAWCARNMVIGGYWENWSKAISPGSDSWFQPEYYSKDFKHFSHIYYSFLTLAHPPNPYSPPNKQWDGKAIYESMTNADILTVMSSTEYNWQKFKIDAMIQECRDTGKLFIWAIGGWSDLTMTISDEQVPAFVECCVNLLKVAGDGIDFDWEHLSEDAAIRAQQRRVLGKIFPALRQALDENGLADKKIGYTTRFNAFWNDATRPGGVTAFPSDGEGIDVYEAMSEQGYSFADCLNWVNVMMYDVAPADLGAQGAFTLETYKMVLEHFEQYVPEDLVVMGFEPGAQPAGGVWEGMEVDKEVIRHVEDNGYGGVMFWAVNHPAIPPSKEVTGQNAQDLAGYARSLGSSDSSDGSSGCVMNPAASPGLEWLLAALVPLAAIRRKK